MKPVAINSKVGRPAGPDLIYAKAMGVSKRRVITAGGSYHLKTLPIAVQRVLLGVGKRAA